MDLSVTLRKIQSKNKFKDKNTRYLYLTSLLTYSSAFIINFTLSCFYHKVLRYSSDSFGVFLQS